MMWCAKAGFGVELTRDLNVGCLEKRKGGDVRGKGKKEETFLGRTYDQCPCRGEPSVVLAVDEHHAGNDTDVVLPPVTQLMPPFAFDDFAFVDLVNSPEIPVGLVEEDGLKDVLVVRNRRLIGIVVHAELMLVVGAVECHFDFFPVLWIGVCVVHGSVARGLAVGTGGLVFGELDLVFLLAVLGLGCKVRVEVGFKVFFKILAVAVGDGDVVEETGTAQDKLFFPGGRLAQEFQRIIGKDGHDHLVKSFRLRSRPRVFPLAVFPLRVKGSSLQDHTFSAPRDDRRDIRVQANINASGLQICRPVGVEVLKMRERNHSG